MTEPPPLQMIRSEIDVREFQRWMGIRRLQDPDHAMHCLLTEIFGKDLAPKPFRLITPRGGRRGCLYGYTPTGVADLRAAAEIYADPQQLRALNLSSLDSKPMPTHWQPGKRLGFELRVRPVIRKSRRNERPGAEVDAFQAQADTFPEGAMPYSREQVYARWLSGRLDRSGGANLDQTQTRMISFQRTRAVRRLRARHVEGPDAVMRGVLTITESAGFANLLAHGIGRHLAYGYGMLLLRPAPVG